MQLVGGLRRDAATSPVSSDGRYHPLLFDSTGNLKTASSGGASSPADDSAFTPGSSPVTPIGGFADDAAPDSVDEGDIGGVRMSLNRNLYVRIRDNAGNERGLEVDANGDIAATWPQRLDPDNDAVFAGLLTDKIGVTGSPNTSLTPKFAIIDAATNGDNTLVAAVAAKKIRVLAGSLTMTGTAVTIRFESGAGGTALTGQMTPAQGQTIPLPFCPVGHFETAVNTLLNLELGGAQSVDGWLVYVEV